MKYFVTGATGFIGQHLVRRLTAQKRNTVFCLCRNPSKIPADLRSRIHLFVGDCTSESYRTALQHCDVVFHLGGRADFGDGEAYRKDNIDFTDTLISIAQQSKTLKRFVFTSTIGAVDRAKQDACDSPLTEESTPHPLSDYGKSKLVCEQHLSTSKIPYVILRPGWVYGPGMRRQSHVRVFIDAVHRRKLFTRINFPGRVSLLHVDDLVAALLLVAHHPKTIRQIFFAVEDEPVSLGKIFRELGTQVGEEMGRISVNFELPRLLRSLRPVLPFKVQCLFSDVLWASNAKIKRLGFQTQIHRVSGFRTTAHDHFVREKGPKGLAVITGGAGGIGASLCEQLFSGGYDIAIIDQDRQRTAQLAASVEAETIVCDLSSVKGLQAAVKFIETNAERTTILVNNAGIGRRGNFEEIPFEDLTRIIHLNTLAPVILSRVLLPSLVKRGKGSIINIGSSSGFQPLPYMAVYGASKAFIHWFTQGIQGEMLGRGLSKKIEVILVAPSGTATHFQSSSGVRNEDSSQLLQPEAVASRVIRCIGKGSRSIVVGRTGKGMAFASRILPREVQIRLWERLMRKMR